MPHTLQCPRCQRAVQVPDDAAGQRVECPSCQQSFVVPGFSKQSNDDDDWLSLDERPPESMTNAPESSSIPLGPVVPPGPALPGSGLPGSGLPGSAPSSRDAEPLGSFNVDMGELPPFDDLPPLAPVTVRRPSGVPASGLPGSGLPSSGLPSSGLPSSGVPNSATPAPGAPRPTPTGAIPVAKPPEYATEYRVNCPICHTMTYARAEQAGKKIKCNDCHSSITVPPPPKIKPKPQINLDTAETFQFSDSGVSSRPADPFIKSAEQLLRDAEKQEVEAPPPDYDVPSVVEWAKNVFGIFLDPGVLAHWLILSSIASFLTGVALTLQVKILVLGLFAAGAFFGVIVLGCAFAILQSLANDEPHVTEWPVFDPGEWFGQFITAGVAVAYAAVPSYGLAFSMFGHSLTSVAIAMLAIYALFPFLILSILDMQSLFTPFSPEVAKSVTRCEESWGGLYFSAGLLFFGLFMIFVIASAFSPAAQATISIFSGVAVTFIYFAMIGRLAYAIGQAVNDKPMVNDIDRSKKPDEVP